MSNAIRYVLALLLSISFFGCKSNYKNTHNTLKVKFLSEYILPENTTVNNVQVGGLSGIDYNKGTYYLVCDDEANPRFYVATIAVNSNQISNISIDKAVTVHDNLDVLDMESIRFDSNTNQVLITSEGDINNQKDPSLIAFDLQGNVISRFKIPEAFKANSFQKSRHNATLEGLCHSFDKKGYWIGMELPLKADGPEPQVAKTKSPVRITFIDAKTESPKIQFAYYLDPVAKKPLGDFSVNGLTDLLEYDKGIFLIIERSYSSGLGDQGNTIKLFKADARNATNTLQIASLKDVDFIPAKKELLLDFEDIRAVLTNHSVDNIEGITFGPRLPNGHQTLIVVSDNNFNKLGKQLNQFILLEIEE
jgi:hypothetical protein